MKLLIITFLLLISLASFSQSVCERLTQQKKQFYGFKPSSLSQKQMEAKSGELDQFWKIAEENKKEAAKCLSDMILAENEDSFFCFDASSLLLQIDENQEYLNTVQAGIEKSKLEDLQLEPYLRICFYLGVKGKDIGTLTEKLISIPNAKVFLTNHFITLSAIDASLFLYNIMSNEKAERSLIKAITTGNNTARHNAAVVLNLLSTDRGDSLLNSLILKKELADSTQKFIAKDKKIFISKSICKGNTSKSQILQNLKDSPHNIEREYFGFAGNDELICSACKVLTSEDLNIIREARQKSTLGLSDEALHEYFALTKILMTVRSR